MMLRLTDGKLTAIAALDSVDSSDTTELMLLTPAYNISVRQ